MTRIAFGFTFLALCGCSQPSWAPVHQKLPGALLSVWGTGVEDVWAVGADPDDGLGPMVLRYDGSQWRRMATGHRGDLWWVFGFEGGPVFLGGAGGLILRYQDQAFTRLHTPGTDTVFGIWGSAPDELWAVGGGALGATGAFAWRLQGDQWVVAPGFPAQLAAKQALWKVSGRAADDVWMVGTTGTMIHWNGSSLEPFNAGTGESLLTVASTPQLSIAVGGFGTGTILENDGSGWENRGPPGIPGMIGVSVFDKWAYAVGTFGAIYYRDAGGWHLDPTAPTLDESFHSVWLDPEGGAWAVGGQVLSLPLSDGTLWYKGRDHIPGGIP